MLTEFDCNRNSFPYPFVTMLANVALIGVGATWTVFKLHHTSGSVSSHDCKVDGAQRHHLAVVLADLDQFDGVRRIGLRRL